MRTRTRTIVNRIESGYQGFTSNYTTYHCNGSTSTNQNTFPTTLSDNADYIVEQISDVPKGRAKDNVVYHRRMHVQKFGSALTYKSPDAAPGLNVWDPLMTKYWYTKSKPFTDSLTNWRVQTTLGYVDSPPGWSIVVDYNKESKLIENCFEKAQELKADVLLNIIESSQLWPTLKTLATSLPKLRKDWRSIRKVLGTASDNHLAWKFGLSPIIQDMESCQSYVKQIHKDLKRYLRKDVYRYTSAYQLETKFNITNNVANTINGVDCDVHDYGYVTGFKPTVRYVLKVRPVQTLNKLLDSLEFIMSRFASSPANLAWELVPYSFVLDWFVDMRGVCRLLDNVAGLVPYHIVSFERSFKYDLSTQVNFTRRTPCAGGYYHSRMTGLVKYSHYERHPTSVVPRVPSWLGRFGKNQAGLSAALIAQFLLRATRKNTALPFGKAIQKYITTGG